MQRLFNEFVTLFVVLDPFSTLPVFLALTGGLDAAQARRLAVRAVLIAGAVLLFFVIAGQALLQAMGIPLSSFQLAGSVVLFLIGLKMIFGELHQAGDASAPEADHDPAVFPLAIPSIAGPGTMLTVVLLTDHTHHSIVDQIETVVEIAVVLLLTLGVLFAARVVVRLVGRSGVSVIGRVMGLVLASLAVHNAVLAMQALQLVPRT
ncbi:MAG: MarC family protein [Caldimonas sp.]